MSMEQLLGTPFKQQDVWVWGSRDVPGGRAVKCLARDCGRRAWFSASALVYGNILLPWLTSSYRPVVSEGGRHSWPHKPTPAHHWLEVKCWDSRLGSKLRLQQIPSLQVRTGELEWARGRSPSEDGHTRGQKPTGGAAGLASICSPSRILYVTSCNPHSRGGCYYQPCFICRGLQHREVR